jgi:hypothetical protein
MGRRRVARHRHPVQGPRSPRRKIKQEFLERKAGRRERASQRRGDPSCGSQSIGNIDTGGRIGTAPREVFVFAPNAINLVTANGCR